MTRGKSESLIATQSSILLLLEGLLFTQNFMGCRIKLIVQLFGVIASPILIILLCCALLLMMFGAGASNSTYVLGTYNCRDYDLGRAVEQYTWYAMEMNRNLVRCQNSSEWRTGLKNLGVDSSVVDSYRDTPVNFIFGYSHNLPYSPVYDFDRYKFAAFMCAYTYNFSDSNTEVNNGDKDIEQWCYKDNESECEEFIKKLFDTEYEFKYQYINTSHWVYKGTFNGNVYPSRTTLYKTAEANTEWGGGVIGKTVVDSVAYYTIKFSSVPIKIARFAKDKTIYFRVSGGSDSNGDIVYAGEIVDANDGYTKTGFQFQDLNLFYSAHDGTTLPNVYEIIHNPETGENYYGYYPRNNHSLYPQRKHQIKFGDNDFNYAMNSTDSRIWYGDQSEIGDRLLVRFWQEQEYVTECELYTTVRSKMTFEEAIIKVLSEKDEYGENRLQYYYTFVQPFTDGGGRTQQQTYGNHQMFVSPLDTDYNRLEPFIINRYGYDVQSWGKKHCSLEHTSLHRGTDFKAAVGANVHAMIDGKIESIDTSNHQLTLKPKSSVNLWYEENSRDLKIYYQNISPTVSVGDVVKAGDIIGKVDDYKHCITDYEQVRDNPSAESTFLHVSVRIQYDAIFELGYEYVAPEFMFYRSNTDYRGGD